MRPPKKTVQCTPREKIGVILVNLGTPEGLDYFSIRRFLQNFLSDSRVVEYNRFLWQIILQTFILTFRPFKVMGSYKKIWNVQLDESPLLTTTRLQAQRLQHALGKVSTSLVVDFAMRYTAPSIEDVLQKLDAAQCKKILLMPLYPQYSSSTTASVSDCAFSVMRNMRWQPVLRILPPYYLEDAYIAALCQSIVKALKAINFKPQKIIASYHGIPVRYHRSGDPYPCMCWRTTRAIQEHPIFQNLGFDKDTLVTTFQSLFGREEWVKPYTEPSLVDYAKSGVESVIMIAPAFAADCLETLEEIEEQHREAFLGAGGKNFAYVPCLNASQEGIDLLQNLATKQLQGWL